MDDVTASVSDTSVTAESTPTTPTETPATPDAVSTEGAASTDTPVVQADGTPAAPEYTPDFKYKVQDQEKEMEEWVRGLIKDKQTEENFRKLFAKGDGIEVIKQKHEWLKGEFKTASEKATHYDTIVDTLKTDVQNKDFDSFFKRLNIPDKMIYEWVAAKLRYQELPPEEKQRYDSEMELRRRNAELQKELGSTRQQADTFAVQKLEFELNTELSRPEVNSVMREFDQRLGQVGAFRQELVNYAVAKEQTTGKKVTVQEAVQGLLTLMGRFPASQPAAPTPDQGTVTGNPQQVTAPPVIPNLKARGGTPVKKVPKSLDELKESFKSRLQEIS